MTLIRGAVALIGLVASLYSTPSSAKVVYQTGKASDINFHWGVPEEAAKNGSGNVYFKLDAPQTYSWVALGIGSNMETAEIFLIYTDGEGNVTLSTRQGRQHVMPVYEKRSKVELISGSGVEDGRMTATVRCGDCDSLDLSGENDWVAAWLTGDAVDSKNPEATITHHEGRSLFRMNLADAAVSSDANPLSDTNDEESGTVVQLSSIPDEKYTRIRRAHGVIMSLVFVGLYPIGALLMPLFANWFLHSSSQFLAFLLMWAGVGLGVTFAKNYSLYGKQAHTRLGTIVVALLCLQPVLGYLRARNYVRGEKRGTLGNVHMWYGRSLMVLGIINGGLGLQLADNGIGPWGITYMVLAIMLILAYVGSILYSIRMWRRRQAKLGSRPTLHQEQWPRDNMSLDSLHGNNNEDSMESTKVDNSSRGHKTVESLQGINIHEMPGRSADIHEMPGKGIDIHEMPCKDVDIHEMQCKDDIHEMPCKEVDIHEIP